MSVVVAVHVVATGGWGRAEVDAAVALLSAEERSRFSRFVNAADRRDYAAAHALLRSALSMHGGSAPHEWSFEPGPDGKPRLAIPLPGPAELTFNLAHTRGLVACAVANGADVGIDVEPIDRGVDALLLADRYFSPEEVESLQACAETIRSTRFVELWVLKEAYLKATGEGLSDALDAVSLRFEGTSAIRLKPSRAGDSAACWLGLFEPRAGYRLALAVRSTGTPEGTLEVKCFADPATELPMSQLRSSSGTDFRLESAG